VTTPAVPATEARFTAFWLYSRRRAAAFWDAPPAGAQDEYVAALAAAAPAVELRAAYNTAGLSPEVDLILWVVAKDAADLHDLAVTLDRTALGRAMEVRRVYMGTASNSQYDPTHGPAFLQGLAPKRYLSVYPFIKTPDWYLLPYEERRDLMIDHGRMGREYPSVLTNTVNSFGIADQEFIVALEDDDPAVLVKMVQRLRAAEVRKYTSVDTPIYLGLRKEPADAIASLF
jgi:chlorite dismutase